MGKFLIAAIIIALIGCRKEVIKVNEIPMGLAQIQPDTTIYSKLLKTFPQSVNNRISNPVFFADGIQKNIVISKSTLVYLTFINENANTRNTVGWYSYKSSNPPKKKSDIKMKVLFPNASMVNSSGKLKTGNMLQLQTELFTPGTVVGFFLISDGYQNETVVWSQPIQFTNFNLNKDKNQQHILYVDQGSGNVVLSFEDMPTNLHTDSDYDDVVFIVSDNYAGTAPTSFDLNGVVIH